MRPPKPIVGLLPLGPRRAYLYWDFGRGNNGGRYLHGLQPAHSYVAEYRRNGAVVARSAAVPLPPELPATAPAALTSSP